VLATGIAWDQLPQQLGFGSGMTCWRRLRDWNHAGVWNQLHQLLLAELRRADQLDWSRAVIDAAHLRALKGGGDRRKSGRSRTSRQQAPPHLRCAGHSAGGQPDGGNAHDVTQLLALVDQIPAVRGKRGRPRQRPTVLVADRGYDFDRYRRALRARGIRPLIARRGTPHGSGLGRQRWVVERTLSWLHQFKRLRIRWEQRADIHEAFLRLACCLICWRYLETSY
jgi:transposase